MAVQIINVNSVNKILVWNNFLVIKIHFFWCKHRIFSVLAQKFSVLTPKKSVVAPKLFQ